MKQILKIIQLNINEQKLVEKASKGSRDAQHKLYALYAPKMLSVCRYYVKDLQFAEDVMVSGFFKVFKNVSSYRGDGSFEGWIRRIMVHECLSFIRSKKKLIFVENESELEKGELISNEFELEVGVEEIQQIIDQLPDGYKTVFLLFAVEGYSHKEIANRLEIKESTSKSQLFKARKMLQDGINKIKSQRYESQSS